MKFEFDFKSQSDYRIKPLIINGKKQLFLQFKDFEVVKNGFFFTAETKVEVWRFVPNKLQYLRDYLVKNNCPVNLNLDSEFEYVSGTEEEIKAFVKIYPNIDIYIDFQNYNRAMFIDNLNKDIEKMIDNCPEALRETYKNA